MSSEIEWRRSTFSQAGNCFETHFGDGFVLVRNSNLVDGVVLRFTPEEWRAFVLGVKAGEFDDLR